MFHLRVRRRCRRAFTLLETAVVVGFIGVLSAIVVLSFGGGNTQASDRTAQTNVNEVLDASVTYAALNLRMPATTDDLAGLLTGDVAVQDADQAASAAADVSVWLGSQAVAAAASGIDGACWMAYVEVESDTGRPQRLYAFVPAASLTACTGEAASTLPLVVPSGHGASWAQPAVLS